ncbi:MAG: ribose-phosphate diphosphokinase [Bdellovibrionales bacterium]
MSKLKIITGNSNPGFAKAVAEAAGINLGDCMINRFADGESQVEIHESIRGCDVFVVQSTCPPVNESYMELFIMLDALKRASAKSITAVVPYYGYARQDRKVRPRVPISAKCVSDLLQTAGADRILSVDLHSTQIQGFVNCPFDHLYAIPTLAKQFKEVHGSGDEFVVVSPDAGGVERARAFAKRLNCSIAIVDKRRLGPNEAKAYNLIGDVEGKKAIVVDDIVDTAGTLAEGCGLIKANGAKNIYAVITHPLLSGPAVSRIKESHIEELWVTDTIPLSEEAKTLDKIKIASVAPLVAEAIKRIHGNDSVSTLFEG